MASDPERSLLIGGVASVTLSAREAAQRPDGERQVSRRYQSSVFGAALELRGFSDWVLHADLEKAVDAFLDYGVFAASWRRREGATVTATPLAGCRMRGSCVSFGYALLARGETLPAGTDLRAADARPAAPARLRI